MGANPSLPSAMPGLNCLELLKQINIPRHNWAASLDHEPWLVIAGGDGMRAYLLEATEKVRAEMGDDIRLKPQRWKQIEFVMLSGAARFLW